MPLKSGKSSKTIKKNISTLVKEKPGATRGKAIKTLAKKKGISEKQAKQKQAIAIAYSKAGQSRKKK